MSLSSGAPDTVAFVKSVDTCGSRLPSSTWRPRQAARTGAWRCIGTVRPQQTSCLRQREAVAGAGNKQVIPLDLA